METRIARQPISLFQKHARPPDAPSTSPAMHHSHMTPVGPPQTPKKKIILNRRVVPRITIRVDQLIRDTYFGLASGRLKNVTDSPAVLNNDALIDYIRAIYETYDIEDPIRKYRGDSVVGAMTPSTVQKRDFSQSHGISLSIHRNAGVRLSEPKHHEQSTLGRTLDRTDRDRSSSKRKIQDLKDSIRNGGNQEPVEVRTISLSSANRKSSGQIRRRIMYDTNQFLQPQPQPQSMHMPNPHLSQSQRLIKPSSSHSFSTPPLFLHRHSSQIQPTFRFCFMCESPILQANIDGHQKRCPHFLELYQLDCQQIVGLLVEKINRLKGQIRQTMKTESVVPETEKDLKSTVDRWMRSVDEDEAKGTKDNEREYQQIVKVLDRPCFRLLELTYRLKWFLRMREHIKSKFQI